ncbi:MAG: sigma-54-dependent Fis family transcriptional regulator [Gammaproteobacteria bacterium RBG_16_57_12]|nr:MAG: sigma-54-dependent Fis family transcriptional regulator [Gammaproteobacteria bacterium RBG_16_57_12]
MAQHTALIIDDEPDIRELMALTLGRMNIETFAAESLAQAQKMLQSRAYDLCLTDLKLPDGSGLTLVSHIQAHYPEMPVAVITAHGNMEAAVQALKDGAFDFVSKPIDLGLLRKLVNSALQLKQFPESDRRSRHILLGDSPAMQATRSMVAKVARSQAPVYISGESGTGKELVARLIHEKGPHPDQPFVPVNCGAIPTELMESEFFGHKKGSFTGAVSDKAGLFHAAHGGTLFLDEVADLPLHMQVKLLRAIQEKAVRPVGEQKEIPIDVRILAATHKNLAPLVEEGRFRQDLYYRLNVIELKVPALRERAEDIPLLTGHILTRLAQQAGTRQPAISREALATLQHYPFPGNVRELENILERAMTLCENNLIEPDDLQLPGAARSETAPDLQSATLPSGLPLEEHLETIERKLITDALEKARHNKTAAAKLLGVSFRALRYRLKKLGME